MLLATEIPTRPEVVEKNDVCTGYETESGDV